jgi:hypothetical protein
MANTFADTQEQHRRNVPEFARRHRLTEAQADAMLQACTLASTAAGSIHRGAFDSACWRLADALRLLAPLCPDAVGIAYPTGRKARLATEQEIGATS